MSTQAGFGRILDNIARSGGPLSERLVTMSPDVSGTTSLGPWINRKKLFSRVPIRDVFKDNKIPSTAMWEFDVMGQHLELGIAEMNLFLALAASGLSHSLFGRRLLPVGTVYDPFVCRGLDAMNYACYQDARFMIVGTPSGATLAPEGGAHQSIGTPLIGMAQDGLVSYEPAYVDELGVIMEWGLGHMQEEHGRSIYLRLTTRPLEQPKREIDDAMAGDIVNGAYWWREPGPNCELVLAYQGAVAESAIKAAGLLAEARRDIGVLAVTSADRLYGDHMAAQQARQQGAGRAADAHVERLLASVPGTAAILTVIDGHPSTLSWLGGVHGHKVLAHGVVHFGQTGTVDDLYRHYGIDHESLVASVLEKTTGRHAAA